MAATSSAGADATFVGLLVFYGLLGYLYAVWTRRSIGTTPWRIPALAWGVLSALLPLFGLMLELLARLTTRHVGSPGLRGSRFGAGSGPGAPPYGSAPPGYGATGSANPRAPSATPWGEPWRANPAGGATPWPETVATRPGPNGWRPPSPGDLAPSTTPPLFGWYADPDAAHEERYWDGRQWTDHVRDAGQVSEAPLSDWQQPTPWAQATSVPPPPPGAEPVAPAASAGPTEL